MAAAHGTATHLQAGPVAASAPMTTDEVREYERILRISDEIFAGSHPRLKVPQQFVRKPAARNSQAGPLPQQVANGKPSIPSAEDAATLKTTRSSEYKQAPVVQVAPSPAPANVTPSSVRVASKPTSEIDPIFLTKSDDLVRAEIQLQRQRVERSLRDQLEQRKHDSKQKPAVQDTKPDFDVSEVLHKALQVVRPVSPSDPSEANADSFDDDSFYSSRAPDSPQPVEGQRRTSPVAPAQPPGPAGRVPVDHYGDELQRLEALNRPGSDQEMRDAYPVADQRVPHHQKPPFSGQAEVAPRPYEPPPMEPLEEPEYSPPAPVAPPIYQRDYEREVAYESGRGRHIDRNRDTQQPASPAGVTIVRQNHITTPAAPRPSRVSPLAMAKVPSVQQLQEKRDEHGSDRLYSDPESTRGSPSGPAPRITSRKRRRLQGGRVEGTRNVPYRSQNAQPSDTYIKEEPVSPPPFADDPTVIRSRQPQEQPVYIDIASPRYTPVLERREPSVRRPVYEVEPYAEVPVDQGHSRPTSRLGTRRPYREEGDLRRVASLHHARQAEYPREYVEAEPRASRAASYTVMGRPLQERPRYYEEVPSEFGLRHIAVDDLPQPVYRDPYYEDVPPARPIGQPQRRIVVDEHGHEYEMIPTSRQQPMAPPPRPVSRMPEGDVYDDRVPVRTASDRAPSVIHDVYGERRYGQDIPPPPPVYRRVVSDYAHPAGNDRLVYSTPLDGHEPYHRSGSVQVAEYIPRRPAYVEEHAAPQERMIRTASVRPQHVRYEQPHPEVVQRVGSARPPGPSSRHPSVFLDDRRMGDYAERPYYVRERRYYDGDETKRMTLEGGAEPAHHVPQHF